MSKRLEHGNAIEVVIVVVLVLIVAGLIIWRLLDRGNVPSPTTDSTSQAETQVSLKEFTSQKYQIRFKYPAAWSVEEVVSENKLNDLYVSETTVKNQSGDVVATLKTGGQLGGGCPTDSTFWDATTITDDEMKLHGVTNKTHFGYTILHEDGAKKYSAIYGINNGELGTGVKREQCEAMGVQYAYTFSSSIRELAAMSFSIDSMDESVAFDSFDAAKQYASSDNVKQVEAMVSSLSIGQ